MKSEYFYSYKLPSAILNIPTKEIWTQLVSYGIQFIKIHNNKLAVKKYETDIHPKYPALLYITFITSPNNNHPYILFCNMSTDIATLLIPYGGDYKQMPLNDIPKILNKCNYMEKYALYLSILKTTTYRKSAILENDQFNLIKCSNITNCIRKMKEINIMKISKKEKAELMREYEIYYYHKAVKFLTYYFTLLNEHNYIEAKQFLKGDTGKYKGKQRLNTFFTNSKSIIGHLQIFINLYEMGSLLSAEI